MIIKRFKIFEALTTRDELNKPVDVGENKYIEPALMTKDE